jgi:hypothetical protein
MVPDAHVRIPRVADGIDDRLWHSRVPVALAYRGAAWLRPVAWIYAAIMMLNGLGHTLFTIRGHTVASVSFPRPAPGFYSSPFLLAASVWMIIRLRQTALRQDEGHPALL